MALNLKSSLKTPGSGITSGMLILPSSMFTTSDIVGRSDGDTFVHRRATFTVFSASVGFISDPNLSSTSLIMFAVLCR